MPMANSPRHSQPIWCLGLFGPPTSVRILYQCRHPCCRVVGSLAQLGGLREFAVTALRSEPLDRSAAVEQDPAPPPATRATGSPSLVGRGGSSCWPIAQIPSSHGSNSIKDDRIDFSSAERAKLRAGEFEIEWFSTPVGWSSLSQQSLGTHAATRCAGLHRMRTERRKVIADARR